MAVYNIQTCVKIHAKTKPIELNATNLINTINMNIIIWDSMTVFRD